MPATASPIAAEALNSTVTPLVSAKEVAAAWMREMSLEDAVVKGFARIEWETLILLENLSSLKKGQGLVLGAVTSLLVVSKLMILVASSLHLRVVITTS
jgi:hypothetical protein